MLQSSPRPSVDGHRHGAAPFLHNLTQRLRKGSSAESIPSAPVTDPVMKTEDSRRARQAILSLVRDDWDWPGVPPDSRAEHIDKPRIPHRDPLTYRLREEAQSDIEAEDFHNKRRARNDPYMFESADKVGNFVVDRKTKRRRLLEEEMMHNRGLRIWQERRDAWTGAVHRKPSSNKPTERRPSSTTTRSSHKSRLSQAFGRDKSVESNSPSKPHAHAPSQSLSTDGSGSISWDASPTSPTPESSSIDSVEASSPAVTTRTTTNTAVDTNSPLTPSSTIVSSSSPSTGPGPWLPIYPPILARDNIARDRIKPAAYPTIYSKIVVQGLTPNVPIPLNHMIPALVEGWKSEGNWPPQPSAPLAADVKKGLKSSTFAKWRSEYGDRRKGGEVGVPETGHDAHEDSPGRRSSLRKSIGVMRKMGSFLGGAMSSSDGLGELGIEFNEKDASEMGRNVALNRGLAH